MFRGLRLGQAGEILQCAKRSTHSAGSIIFQGTPEFLESAQCINIYIQREHQEMHST